MPLDHMWAEWRLRYVSEVIGEQPPQNSGACVLCAVLDPDLGELSYEIHRGEHCSVVLNRYPYTNGHVLVIPHSHVAQMDDLKTDEAAELWQFLRTATAVIRHAYDPGGINLGANLGSAAGAGIPDHLHFHILPRWRGDTNFMTSVADTRVMPESLPSSAQRLIEAWAVVSER
ncbi:MAG: HIT domain-containing protein [Acidimicrobiales bacterium]